MIDLVGVCGASSRAFGCLTSGELRSFLTINFWELSLHNTRKKLSCRSDIVLLRTIKITHSLKADVTPSNCARHSSSSAMEPRITKRERKLQLTYDLPHRIRCARIYPVPCANGSTLLLYGHDQGIKLLYRGGRRPKRRTAQVPTGPRTRSKDVVILDDSEEEEPQQAGSSRTEYEDQEDETDPDTPHPNIIQELDLKLGSAVLHLAAPLSLSPQISQRPAVARHHAIVAAYTADGTVTVLQIPLAPAPPADYRDVTQEILDSKIELPAGKTMVGDISIKILTKFRGGSLHARSSEAESTICVAAASDALRLWRLPTNADEILLEEASLQRLPLPSIASKVSYHPSSGSAQTLSVDAQSAVRIYDPFALKDPNLRPSSSDSMSIEGDEVGKWVMAFQAPYHALPQDHPTIPARKKILDAKWILNGRAILTLLDDGEWGIWDVSASAQSSKAVGEFTLHGFLGSAGVTAHAESGKKLKGSSKLAPMTPNTRKTKSQNFFSGAPKAPGAVSKGGISVTGSDNLTGQSDESVMLWYDGEVYTIPNVQLFWQRSLNVSSTGLYAPGLSHIPDVNLMNENITSISQFSAKTSSSGLGQMNTPRDFLVSCEHRFVIHQATRPPVPTKGLFDKAAEKASAPTDRDQRMLDAGELDVGGMDRMLDSMANGGAARPRRVGFAPS